MANEITLTGSIAIGGETNFNRTENVDQTNRALVSKSMAITTAGSTLTDLNSANAGWLRLQNVGLTPIDFGPVIGGTHYPITTILPGEFQQFRLAASTIIKAVAIDAASELSYTMCEN